MININSLNYNNEEVEFRYYVDTQDVWWYCYEDICNYLELKGAITKNLYKYKINEKDKINCNDLNSNMELQFISSNAVRYLVNRNNQRIKKLLKVMNNIEFVGDAHEIHDDANELKARIELLNESLKIDDYQEILYQSYEIVNSKSGRDILDKAGIIDKDKEELLDLIRSDIYEYDDYIDDVEVTLITRKENMNDTFKQYEYNKESTCPSWLRNVVK